MLCTNRYIETTRSGDYTLAPIAVDYDQSMVEPPQRPSIHWCNGSSSEVLRMKHLFSKGLFFFLNVRLADDRGQP